MVLHNSIVNIGDLILNDDTDNIANDTFFNAQSAVVIEDFESALSTSVIVT